MKNIIVLIVLSLSVVTTRAQSESSKQQNQEKGNKNAKVEFHVSGNCEMCKKRIEKAAYSVSGVKSADWHMDCDTLYLIINEQKTDVTTIQKAIAKVGHDTEGIKATDEDYEKLHTCCSYERE